MIKLIKEAEGYEEYQKDLLHIRVYQNREALGQAAAQHVAGIVEKLGQARIIFAAAPSQNEFQEHLHTLVNWSTVEAFQMDDYHSLPPDHPALFSKYLAEIPRLNKIRTGPDIVVHLECQRYGKLLCLKPIDLCCAGVGENGHLAFNDPHVADFDDPLIMKEVILDDECRNQQVDDGCFDSLDAVPNNALTLTIPTLMAAEKMSVVVPGLNKAEAIAEAMHNPISALCPASVLRTHQSAILFLDRESAYLLRTA